MARSQMRLWFLSSASVFWLGVGIIGLSFLLFHLTFPSPALESMDSVLFTRGLIHYDVLSQRPQWPGYPVYLGLGHLMGGVTGDPLTALRSLSVLSSALLCLPLAALVRQACLHLKSSEWAARTGGWSAALLWTVTPLAQHSGTEVYSDPPALLLGALTLWCLSGASSRAGNRSSLAYFALAGSLLALTLGCRLSYLPLLLAALPLLWVELRNRRFSSLLAFALPFTVVCGAWLGWQLLEGGENYWTALRRHLSGHYTQWGESVATDANPTLRPGHFLSTLATYGLGAGWGPFERTVATLGWTVLLGLGVRQVWQRARPRFPWGWGVLVFAVSYAVWLYLGNDVQLERLYLPLVPLLCAVAALGGVSLGRVSLAGGKVEPLKWTRGLQVAATLLLIGSVAAVSLPLTFERSRTPVPEVQLAVYAEREMPLESQLFLPFDQSLLRSYTALPSLNLGRVPGDRTPLARRSLLQGQVPFSASYAPLEDPQGWQQVARFCPVRGLHSRETRDLVLYRYSSARSRAVVSPSLPCTPYPPASALRGFVQ